MQKDHFAFVFAPEQNPLRTCQPQKRAVRAVEKKWQQEDRLGMRVSVLSRFVTRKHDTPPTLLLKPEPLIMSRVPPAKLPRLGVTSVIVTGEEKTTLALNESRSKTPTSSTPCRDGVLEGIAALRAKAKTLDVQSECQLPEQCLPASSLCSVLPFLIRVNSRPLSFIIFIRVSTDTN